MLTETAVRNVAMVAVPHSSPATDSRLVGTEVTAQLVLVFINSRLDYCNSVHAGLQQTTLEPLPFVSFLTSTNEIT